MRVAINITPLENASKNRGIGSYTRNLVENLEYLDLELIKFKNISEVKDVDVVHYPWFDLFFRSLPLKQPFPAVVTVHDLIPLIFPQQHPVGPKGKINFYLQKLALRKYQVVITDSEASKKDIVKYLKIDQKKIKVIYEAANDNFKILSDDAKVKIKRKYNLPDEFLLYVGDANYTKNLPFLIEGFNKLKDRFESLKLVLVGGVFLKKVDDINHPELEALKKMNQKIEQFDIRDIVIRPGRISDEDLVGFYNLAKVYVQPSLYEGFGLPILEAMSCGCPVISSNAASLPEVGGDAALYFDPASLNQFITLTSQLLMSKSLRFKLADLGLHQAAKFSWSQTALETVKAYEEAIE